VSFTPFLLKGSIRSVTLAKVSSRVLMANP
jgi:hypothetical protein